MFTAALCDDFKYDTPDTCGGFIEDGTLSVQDNAVVLLWEEKWNTEWVVLIIALRFMNKYIDIFPHTVSLAALVCNLQCFDAFVLHQVYGQASQQFHINR